MRCCIECGERYTFRTGHPDDALCTYCRKRRSTEESVSPAKPMEKPQGSPPAPPPRGSADAKKERVCRWKWPVGCIEWATECGSHIEGPQKSRYCPDCGGYVEVEK